MMNTQCHKMEHTADFARALKYHALTVTLSSLLSRTPTTPCISGMEKLGQDSDQSGNRFNLYSDMQQGRDSFTLKFHQYL